jgi:hypothetical protein
VDISKKLQVAAKRYAQAVKRQKMKDNFSKTRFVVLSIIFLLFSPDLISQTLNYQDSLIRITKTKTFLISRPAPQYVLEIKNDTSISFYNILPENFTEHQAELIGSWIVDSTTLILEKSDFIELINTIKRIGLKNIDKIQKPKSESGIEIHIVGGASDKYIIEFTSEKVEFSIGPNNEKYISESAKIVRNIIEELEEKYKPEK